MISERRRFLKHGLLIAGTMVVTAGFRTALAMQELQESDPEAVAIGYYSKTSRVDRNKYPNYEQGQRCANCALSGFSSGMRKPCKLVPGKFVNGGGWCSKWVAKS